MQQAPESSQTVHFFNQENRQIVARALEFLWGDACSAELVVGKRRGWVRHLASGIHADPTALQRAIKALGHEAFQNLVIHSPAGQAPEVVAAEQLMASTHGSCLHGTGTCGSCLHQTGTCNTCAACIGPDGALLN